VSSHLADSIDPTQHADPVTPPPISARSPRGAAARAWQRGLDEHEAQPPMTATRAPSLPAPRLTRRHPSTSRTSRWSGPGRFAPIAPSGFLWA